MLFEPQNYTVTEGDLVNITLVAMSPPGGYEFDFTVTLQAMKGSAVGESFYIAVTFKIDGHLLYK